MHQLASIDAEGAGDAQDVVQGRGCGVCARLDRDTSNGCRWRRPVFLGTDRAFAGVGARERQTRRQRQR